MKNQDTKIVKTGQLSDSTAMLINKAARLADAGQYEEALGVLAKAKTSTAEVSNARGVCFMRLGRYEAALRTFRSFVMQSGCTWMRSELPIHYRANFSTALLLSNLPLGARATLFEITEKDHPSVVRVQEALNAWQNGLSWWQRLSWKLGKAPAIPVTIDFVPGDFLDPLTTTLDTPPMVNSRSQQLTPQVAL